MGLALDAARHRRLEVEPRGRDAVRAGLTYPVSALAYPLQRPLDLLPVLVQQMDEEIGGLAVRQGLREVGVFRDRHDHAADDVGKRAVQPSLLTAGAGELRQGNAAGFEPFLGCVVGSLANCHCKYPPFLCNTAARYSRIRSHNAGVVQPTRSLTISRP